MHERAHIHTDMNIHCHTYTTAPRKCEVTSAHTHTCAYTHTHARANDARAYERHHADARACIGFHCDRKAAPNPTCELVTSALQNPRPRADALAVVPWLNQLGYISCKTNAPRFDVDSGNAAHQMQKNTPRVLRTLRSTRVSQCVAQHQ